LLKKDSYSTTEGSGKRVEIEKIEKKGQKKWVASSGGTTQNPSVGPSGYDIKKKKKKQEKGKGATCQEIEKRGKRTGFWTRVRVRSKRKCAFSPRRPYGTPSRRERAEKKRGRKKKTNERIRRGGEILFVLLKGSERGTEKKRVNRLEKENWGEEGKTESGETGQMDTEAGDRELAHKKLGSCRRGSNAESK